MQVLHILFNEILKSTTYQKLLKMGLVTPLYKNNRKSIFVPENYREITVVHIIAKTFERIYLERIRCLINRNQSKLQFGFTANTSIMVAAVLMSEAVTETKSNKHKKTI